MVRARSNQARSNSAQKAFKPSRASGRTATDGMNEDVPHVQIRPVGIKVFAASVCGWGPERVEETGVQLQ
jgi:hypothetical protein